MEPYLQSYSFNNIRLWFLSSPYIPQLFYTSLPPFYHILKRWIPTSIVTPTPTSDSHSFPTLTYLNIFSTSLPSFQHFLKRWSPTSNVTRTSKSDSDSSPRVTHPRNFSRLFTTILTFSSSGGALPPTSPLRQWSSRTSVAKTRYSRPNTTSPTFFPPLYHYFKFLETV